MKADILRDRFEGSHVFKRMISQIGIYNLNANQYVPKQFATKFARNAETSLGWAENQTDPTSERIWEID